MLPKCYHRLINERVTKGPTMRAVTDRVEVQAAWNTLITGGHAPGEYMLIGADDNAGPYPLYAFKNIETRGYVHTS